jgi:hypothetical protein
MAVYEEFFEEQSTKIIRNVSVYVVAGESEHHRVVKQECE